MGVYRLEEKPLTVKNTIFFRADELNDVEHRQGTCMLAPGRTDMLSNVKFTQHGKTLEKDGIFENAIKSTLQHLTYPTDKLTSITLAHSKLYFFSVSHPTTS